MSDKKYYFTFRQQGHSDTSFTFIASTEKEAKEILYKVVEDGKHKYLVCISPYEIGEDK